MIDSIVTATLKSRVVHAYLATIERPWCDRRSNKVWQCVLDAAKLEAHLGKLLGQLGLERRAVDGGLIEQIQALCRARW